MIAANPSVKKITFSNKNNHPMVYVLSLICTSGFFKVRQVSLNFVKISMVLSFSCSRKHGSHWKKLHLLCALRIYSLCSKQCCPWSARSLEHHTYGYFMCTVSPHSRADFTGHVSHLGARRYPSFTRKETDYTEALPTSLGNKQAQCLKLHLAHIGQ